MPPQTRNTGSPRNEIVSAYFSLPVITRFLLTVTLGTTLILKTGLLPYPNPKRWILREIMSTSIGFFYGGSGLSLLFNLFFLYQYSIQLEKGRYAGKPADYAWFLIWCSSVIRILHIPLGGGLYNSALTQSIVYFWSQDFKDTVVTFMFGFRFKGFYLSYVLLAMEFLTAGPGAAISSATGLAAAYAFNFLDYEYPLSRLNNRRSGGGQTTASSGPNSRIASFSSVVGSQGTISRQALPVKGTRILTATPKWFARLIPYRPPTTTGPSTGGGSFIHRGGQQQPPAAGGGGIFGRHRWGRGRRLGD